MTLPLSWRKSSLSQTATECVEVANTLGAVRDTKHRGSVLTVDVRALVKAVREDRVG